MTYAIDIKKLLVLFLTLLALDASAMRATVLGPGDGGGGGVIVCPQADGSLQARLVDLVEMEFYEGYQPTSQYTSLGWKDQLNAIVKRVSFVDPEFSVQLIRASFYVGFEIENGFVFSKTKNTKIVFPMPLDLSTGRVPPMEFGCQILGAAEYSSDDFGVYPNYDAPDHISTDPDPHPLTISAYLWNNLSEQDKAALAFHESVYVAQRALYKQMNLPTPNSSDTRRMVGMAFSTLLDKVELWKTEADRFDQPKSFKPIDFNNGVFLGEWQWPFYHATSPFVRARILNQGVPVYLNDQDCRTNKCLVSAIAISNLTLADCHAVASVVTYGILDPRTRELPAGDRPNTWIYEANWTRSGTYSGDEDVTVSCPAPPGVHRLFGTYLSPAEGGEAYTESNGLQNGFGIRFKSINPFR